MANGAQPIVKISGYLEKKAKLRIGSPWKKYWFVQEDRLLLYYRSKDEYETLSPCKGSINLCPPCHIKPALSAARVFHIECRASTVTLRAENRAEQERWMQGLLGAIAQSKSSPNRMSHFRYSLDDLPGSIAENKKADPELSRQNTMPHRISSSPSKDSTTIIGRLQQMGAHTYGGSLGQITKLAHKDQVERRSTSSIDVIQDLTFTVGDDTTNRAPKPHSSTPMDKQSYKSQSVERIQSVFVENDQYGIIQEENSIDVYLDNQDGVTPLAEKVKSLLVDNAEYLSEDVVRSLKFTNGSSNESNLETSEIRQSFMLENEDYFQGARLDETYFIRNTEVKKIEHLYERISTDSNIIEYNTELRSFHKTKQNGTNLYERISSSSSNSDTQINNNQYSVVQKDDKQSSGSFKQKTMDNPHENVYSLPIHTKNIDHNKNSLLVDNDQYVPVVDDQTNDNLYSNGLMYTTPEYAAVDKTKEQEALYEDPDHLMEQPNESQPALYFDIDPILPPRPDSKWAESSEETTSQTSNEGRKPKKNRLKMLAQLVRTDRKGDSNTEGGKPKTKKRQTSFIRKVWRRKAKSLDADDDAAYETVDDELIEKRLAKDKNDVQMLQELQKILEERKNMLHVKLNEKKVDGTTVQSAESKVQPIVEEKEEESLEIRTAQNLNEERPSLPPRQSLQSSPNHDPPPSNQAMVESPHDDTLVKTSASDSNHRDTVCMDNQSDVNVKTIDEILQDLDEQKGMQETSPKVKQLIEKFNDIHNEDEVVLRKKAKFLLCKSQSDTTVLHKLNAIDKTNRESNELTMLLEELSKVTCAPVLAPGVTSSLVTPVLTDDEWLQLIPIRRRRLSDPDYDVPRPHRSLQLQGRSKQVPDNPIPATRFFGPILPPSSTNDNVVTTDLPSLASMDPDSLELEHLPSTTDTDNNLLQQTISSFLNTDKDTEIFSYSSHSYLKDEKTIYAHPKTLLLSTKLIRDDSIYSNVNLDDPRNTKPKNLVHAVEATVKTIKINENLLPFVPKSEEMFIDSLEPLAEISTAF